MKNYIVRPYYKEDFELWNTFVSEAKNATFLFHRNFVEYHSDRFEDFSLMVFEEKKIVAILPANRVGYEIFSHQGLTYGGLVLKGQMKSVEVFHILDMLIDFLKKEAFKKFVIKPIPVFYKDTFSFEIEFYLHQNGFVFLRKDMNLAHKLVDNHLISNSKLKKYRSNTNVTIDFQQEDNFKDFWNLVLIPRLAEKHQAKPVHTLVEIEKLAQNFPNQIKQFNAYLDDQIVAGITIFESKNVVKSQYGATTIKGEQCRALDFLFLSLYEKYAAEKKTYFDMGIVTDTSFENGFNSGLLNQKEELGCVVFEQNHYALNL